MTAYLLPLALALALLVFAAVVVDVAACALSSRISRAEEERGEER